MACSQKAETSGFHSGDFARCLDFGGTPQAHFSAFLFPAFLVEGYILQAFS